MTLCLTWWLWILLLLTGFVAGFLTYRWRLRKAGLFGKMVANKVDDKLGDVLDDVLPDKKPEPPKKKTFRPGDH